MISNTEIYNALVDAGCNPNPRFIFLDDEYRTPTRHWIEAVFAPALNLNLDTLGLLAWSKNAWDCDKFARYAWTLAGLAHARMLNVNIPAAGFAFGVVCYTTDAGKSHCINIVIADEERQVVFFEPQTQRIITLTSTEIASCSVCIF